MFAGINIHDLGEYAEALRQLVHFYNYISWLFFFFIYFFFFFAI